jgi:hypothetical protein
MNEFRDCAGPFRPSQTHLQSRRGKRCRLTSFRQKRKFQEVPARLQEASESGEDSTLKDSCPSRSHYSPRSTCARLTTRRPKLSCYRAYSADWTRIGNKAAAISARGLRGSAEFNRHASDQPMRRCIWLLNVRITDSSDSAGAIPDGITRITGITLRPRPKLSRSRYYIAPGIHSVQTCIANTS